MCVCYVVVGDGQRASCLQIAVHCAICCRLCSSGRVCVGAKGAREWEREGRGEREGG